MKRYYVLNLLILARLIQFSAVVFIFYNFPDIINNIAIIVIAEFIIILLKLYYKNGRFKNTKKKIKAI